MAINSGRIQYYDQYGSGPYLMPVHVTICRSRDSHIAPFRDNDTSGFHMTDALWEVYDRMEQYFVHTPIILKEPM